MRPWSPGRKSGTSRRASGRLSSLGPARVALADTRPLAAGALTSSAARAAPQAAVTAIHELPRAGLRCYLRSRGRSCSVGCATGVAAAGPGGWLCACRTAPPRPVCRLLPAPSLSATTPPRQLRPSCRAGRARPAPSHPPLLPGPAPAAPFPPPKPRPLLSDPAPQTCRSSQATPINFNPSPPATPPQGPVLLQVVLTPPLPRKPQGRRDLPQVQEHGCQQEKPLRSPKLPSSFTTILR